jgi:spore coat polysaccharide biosynthesis protein SpsF
MVLLITQARMTSSRLPGKILKRIDKESLLGIQLGRLKKSKLVNNIVVATTDLPSDNITVNEVENLGVSVFRGSEFNVLDRYYQAAKKIKPNYLVRVTADCPLIDSDLIDKVIDFTICNNFDYCSNTLLPTYPDGQDVEVFKFEVLENAWVNAKLASELEHVTPYIWKNSSFKGGDLFCSENFSEGLDFSNIRMTVDEPEDFEVIKILVENLGTNRSWLEYCNFIIDNNLLEINKKIFRNDGYYKSLLND